MTGVSDSDRHLEPVASLAGLLDEVEDAVVAVDAQWFVTGWNRGAERMYGWTTAEVLGRHTLEVARLDMSDEERTEVRIAVAEQGRWRGEVVAFRKDGSSVCVEVINVAQRGAEGEITGYLGIHRDVTERKLAEQALRDARHQSETILESITDAFVAVDRQWRYTYVNERALRRMEGRTGRPLTREDVIGRGMWEMFPDVVGSEIYDGYQTAMREQRPVALDSYFAVTGEWIEAHAYPSEAGLSIYYRDVSERHRAEAALHEARRQTETILESVADAFLVVDREWRYTYINDDALRRLQAWRGTALTRQEVVGRSMWEMFPEVTGTEVEGKLSHAMRAHEPVQFELYFEPTGEWVEARAFPSATGLSVHYHNITARKAAQEEMRSRAEQQALVAQLGQRALASDDLQSLLDDAGELVARTLDVELVGVAELLPSGDAVFRAGVGWRAGVVGQIGRHRRDSLLHYTLRRGEPVIVEDMASDPRFTASAIALGHGAVSALAGVIASPDGAFGTLAALSTRRRTFSRSDVSFLQAIANVLASAVERSRAQQQLHEVTEAERSRIARDLHDEALQELTEAVIRADRGRSAGLSPAAAEALAARLRRVSEALRGAIYDLRLPAHESRGFPDALRALVDVHRALAVGSEIHLDLRDGVPAGPLGSTGTEVLRILGEALANARRHADARRIDVRAWASDGTLAAEVQDDGRGFDRAAEGHGIRGMRERAALLRGRLVIGSDRANGTTVRLELPLAD
ncbi:MAG TPA: PAS domain S-box protein [Solirubrobacteraceae bacterium]